jgi:hypothetical protein
MWQLWKNDLPYFEGLFISYKEDLSAYHLKAVNRYIEANPYFKGFRKMTPAETIVHYEKEGKKFLFEPEGIMSFKRGRHPHAVLCDDILRDPEVKLDISQIEKITDIFKREVLSLPKEDGFLHLRGTRQDENDIFDSLKKDLSFLAKSYPAVISDTEGKVLWPEMFPIEKLRNIRNSIGEKTFGKEYLCHPVRGAEGFFRRENIDRITKLKLRAYDLSKTLSLREYCYAGFDIGKKTHPSHLAVFGVDRKGRLVQVHSKWMDGWDYIDQLAHIKDAIDCFKIARLYYDNTRAEFESFHESGSLPAEMDGVVFTQKSKFSMASELDKLVTQGRIWLLNEERQKKQLLCVDNDLQAVQTSEGHGDSFFSICLAVKAFTDGQGVGVWELN